MQFACTESFDSTIVFVGFVRPLIILYNGLDNVPDYYGTRCDILLDGLVYLP